LGRLLDRGAIAAGFDTEQWSLRRIAALIWQEFGVRYHPHYLERPLRAYGAASGQPGQGARRARDCRLAEMHVAGH
jgi:putative transposase